MGHQRFENWLLTEEPLKPEQQIELQTHLEACLICRTLSDSWQSVAQHLSATTLVDPAPGFTARWEARLETARALAERRTNLIILAFSTAGFFLVSANQVARAFSGFNLTIEVLVAMVKTIPEIVLIGLWVGATGLAVMSVLWIISIHQFTFQRRTLQ